MRMMTQHDRILTVLAVAKDLGTSPSSVQRLLRRGDLRGLKRGPEPGAPWCVRRSDLRAYKKNRAGGE